MELKLAPEGSTTTLAIRTLKASGSVCKLSVLSVNVPVDEEPEAAPIFTTWPEEKLFQVNPLMPASMVMFPPTV